MEPVLPSGAARCDARWSTRARQYLPHTRTPRTVPVTFHYRRTDPLAVEAVFRCPSHGDDVVWTLGRDLLSCGISSLTGTGDVVLWPGRGRSRVWLRLGPDTGHALLSISRPELAAWLRTTYALVPPGTEEEHLDWTPIHRLLSSPRPPHRT
ncbi:SsgA family sporulation/cell division regulator [Streptomyces sp. NPDC048383]|uniref:SsgA family sporulation/cell division regulator n=1 Tax=Streptomyces sp. NPDC048383 TaxID=3155386 RepID=UPI00341BC273